ncbi:MAG: hypothetical protein V4487_01355 [Chlamydiota bacterium]
MSKVLLGLCFILFLTLFAEAAQNKFDWSAVLVPPSGIDPTRGNQILHFGSKNKPYWENEEARIFVEKYLQEAVPLRSDAEVLKFGSDRAHLVGMFLELGVCTGRTINFIAALTRRV